MRKRKRDAAGHFSLSYVELLSRVSLSFRIRLLNTPNLTCHDLPPVLALHLN